MKLEERLAWAKSATAEEWGEALATLVMGWHPSGDEWLDGEGKHAAYRREAAREVWMREYAWCPIDLISNAWQVHRKMADGHLRPKYREWLFEIAAFYDKPEYDLMLDLGPREYCLAAILAVEVPGTAWEAMRAIERG